MGNKLNHKFKATKIHQKKIRQPKFIQMNKTKMSRTGLTLRYIPKKSKIDKNLKKIYEKKLNSQIRNR